jgi:hypothetical protein
VCFVELVTQAGHPATRDHGGVTLDAPTAALGRFDLLGDFVDVGVQRLQQLPRLRRVGVIDHLPIIASAAAKARAEADCNWPRDVTRARLAGDRAHLAVATIEQ